MVSKNRIRIIEIWEWILESWRQCPVTIATQIIQGQDESLIIKRCIWNFCPPPPKKHIKKRNGVSAYGVTLPLNPWYFYNSINHITCQFLVDCNKNAKVTTAIFFLERETYIRPSWIRCQISFGEFNFQFFNVFFSFNILLNNRMWIRRPEFALTRRHNKMIF